MIICPNCNHQNPDGANQCEACYTPLTSNTSSAIISCPQCGTPVQADARFCGQCGYNLNPDSSSQGSPSPPEPLPETIFSKVGGSSEVTSPSSYNLSAPSPIESSESYSVTTNYESSLAESELESMTPTVSALPTSIDEQESVSAPSSPLPTAMEEEEQQEEAFSGEESVSVSPVNPTTSNSEQENVTTPINPPTPTPISAAIPSVNAATQLQLQTASLLHVQTNTKTELPQGLAVVHMGKPNNQIPPDINLDGFPNSEIVSRVHADIRVEGDTYYIEDRGSSNGTYINHTPLLPGNRHRLRAGDRIALGKGDKVTFIFQFS